MTRAIARRLLGINIMQALSEEALLGSALLGDPESWNPWKAFLTAFFGLKASPYQETIYRQCTGRPGIMPERPFGTVYLVAGRGGGKSFMLCLTAIYLACFRDWMSKLAPGGKPVILIVAPTREQAKIDLSYCRGILEGSPILSRLIAGITANTISLTTGTMVECAVANYKSIRGRSIAVAIIDEAAFLPSIDSAQPDTELMTAILPALGRFGTDGVLLVGSTPYARRGILYDAYKAYYGADDPEVLVWQAGTRVMNPTFSQAIIDREIARDPAPKTAEYMAIFRSDVEGFISLEMLQACTATGVRERGYHSNLTYSAFIDPSGGGKDAFTLAICHREGEQVVLDVIRERHGSPESCTADYSAILKAYKINNVFGDHYAGDWPREAFARHGIQYFASKKPRSELYLAFLPLLISQRVELLDHPKTALQFQTLVRETGKGGKDKVNHATGAHDDACNAVAGAMVMASQAAAPMKFGRPYVVERERSASIGAYTNHPGELAATAIMPGLAHGPEYSAGGGGHGNLIPLSRLGIKTS